MEEDTAEKTHEAHGLMELASRHARQTSALQMQSATCSTGGLHSLHPRAHQAPLPSFHMAATHYLEPFGIVIQVKGKKTKTKTNTV